LRAEVSPPAPNPHAEGTPSSPEGTPSPPLSKLAFRGQGVKNLYFARNLIYTDAKKAKISLSSWLKMDSPTENVGVEAFSGCQSEKSG